MSFFCDSSLIHGDAERSRFGTQGQHDAPFLNLKSSVMFIEFPGNNSLWALATTFFPADALDEHVDE